MISRIHIEEFRDIGDLELFFLPGVNLLIGDNGSGKTSVLKACQYVLGTFFCGFKMDHTPTWTQLTPEAKDFRRRVSSDGDELMKHPIKFNFDLRYEENGQNPIELTDQILTKRNTLGRALTTTFQDHQDYTKGLLEGYATDEGRYRPLPVFVFYSVEDIHTKRKVSHSLFQKYRHMASFGYYHALTENAFLDFWIKRMLILREEEQAGNHELAVVRGALLSALGTDGAGVLQDLSIRINKKAVYWKLLDGREISSEHLPDGLRRVISIVVDLAFRCALLNQTLYQSDSALKSEGTVLIDEIDLHLHPRLQASILKGLRKAFPRLQFIITSHAPMVMSSVDADDKYNIVYKMSYNQEMSQYEALKQSTYGLDVSTIMRMILGLAPRDKQVDERLTHLFDLIDLEKYSEETIALQSL